MSYPNKGKWWEIKNSFFVFLGFLPFVNSLILLHMSNKVSQKKWKIMAWVMIALNCISIFAFFYDVDSRAQGALQTIITVCIVAPMISNFICWFYLISQRAPFLRELANKENKSEFRKQMNQNPQNAASESRVNPQPAEFTNQQTASTASEAHTSPLNLNTATEDELSRLPRLTIVDVTRAIKYRDEHHGFQSTDEFFDAIHAKPHIIAHLRDLVFVEPTPAKRTTNADNNSGSASAGRFIDF